jgi:hypothetical protein
MRTSDYGSNLTIRDRLRVLWRVLRTIVLIVILPLFLLYIFGFSVKTSAEYDCVIQMASQNARVVAVTGEPIKPGLFAWIVYFESGGGLRQGHFYTTISGPRSRGWIEADFYRTPLGATLGVWFKTGGEEMEVYNGAYPCP